MIYCNLKEKNECGAIYYAGSSVEDITGEVQFFKNGKAPVLIKQADKEKILPVFLNKLYAKHKTEFNKDEFREKIAYEC